MSSDKKISHSVIKDFDCYTTFITTGSMVAPFYIKFQFNSVFSF